VNALPIPDRWRTFLAAGIIVLAGAIAYHNSFGGPFVFDDWPTIKENPSIREAGFWAALQPAPDNSASGRPLLNLSLAFNHAVSGEAVWSYHLVNLVIHVLAGLALFGFVRRTLEQPRVRPDLARHATALALVVALAWTCHPLQTESVTYVVQRAESLMGLFYFLTLYAFARAVASPVTWRWSGLAIAACACGMATKEVMVSAPVMALLYDRAFVSATFTEAWRRHRGLLLGLAATWMVLAYGLATTGGNRNGSVGFGSGVTFIAYWLTQPRAIAHYLKLALWPQPLVFEYGTAWIHRAIDVVPYALLIVPLAALAVVAVWRWPQRGFLGAWFFLPLAPTSLMPGINQMIVEHRMYLSLAAITAGTSLIACICVGRRMLLLGLGVTVGFTLLTVRRNRDYHSEIALWGDTVAKRPANALAHRILADYLWQDGPTYRPDQIAAATAHYETALRLAPDSPITHENFGAALLLAGHIEAGMAQTRTALRLDPNRYLAHYNLGLAYVATGNVGAAIDEFRAATTLRPAYVNAHKNLGNALSEAGQPAAAIPCFETALRLVPNDAETLYNFGNALFRLGRFGDAEPRYHAAAQLTPGDADTHEMLGRTLTRMNRNAEALAELERAAQLRAVGTAASRPVSPGWQLNRGRR
jgi:protein O-mannosyl-transferase